MMMKVFYRLLLSVVTISSTSLSVVACYNAGQFGHDSKTYTPLNPSTKASIKDKINNKEIALPTGTNPSTANPDTVKAIKTTLKVANPKLTDDDLASISVGSTTLDNTWLEQKEPVVLTIAGGGGKSDTVTISVFIYADANGIKNKINRNKIVIGSDDSTLSKANIAKIMNVVIANNYLLSIADQKFVSITPDASFDLKLGIYTPVTLNVSDSRAKPDNTKIALEVKRVNNPVVRKQAIQAMNIINKINTAQMINLPAGFPTTFKNEGSYYSFFIRTLQSENPALTNADLSKISWDSFYGKNITLKANEQITKVVMMCFYDTGSKSFEISVVIHRDANAIKTLIENITSPLVLPGAGGTTGQGDINERIKTAMQKENSNLSDYDLSTFTIGSNVVIDDTTPRSISCRITDDNVDNLLNPSVNQSTATITVQSTS